MKKPTILYVDDEEMNLELFDINLGEYFTVITALSGNEGLHTLNRHPDISAVVSDMKMPGMSGLEFIRKAYMNKPGIPYYILTGYEITPEIEQAIQQQIVASYFQKPFEASYIRQTIQAHL